MNSIINNTNNCISYCINVLLFKNIQLTIFVYNVNNKYTQSYFC